MTAGPRRRKQHQSIELLVEHAATQRSTFAFASCRASRPELLCCASYNCVRLLKHALCSEDKRPGHRRRQRHAKRRALLTAQIGWVYHAVRQQRARREAAEAKAERFAAAFERLMPAPEAFEAEAKRLATETERLRAEAERLRAEAGEAPTKQAVEARTLLAHANAANACLSGELVWVKAKAEAGVARLAQVSQGLQAAVELLRRKGTLSDLEPV
ncbi:hypothetical protein WJX81_003876 [Elliptochloris bilobata]|uniref:Uncharacterized protein n=1 Tax=Elliptochloris bilobata TaxID=381761 RepID=A0AAW1RNM8_9CHLO